MRSLEICPVCSLQIFYNFFLAFSKLCAIVTTMKIILDKNEVLRALGLPEYLSTELEITGLNSVSNEVRMTPLPLSALGYLRDGNKIAAIKEVRSVYNCGLKDAKDFVESFCPSGVKQIEFKYYS